MLGPRLVGAGSSRVKFTEAAGSRRRRPRAPVSPPLPRQRLGAVKGRERRLREEAGRDELGEDRERGAEATEACVAALRSGGLAGLEYRCMSWWLEGRRSL